MEKVKLSIDEQIKHLKEKKGVKFTTISEENAKVFLQRNNYYFKLKSYAKNYDKYRMGENKGKYINLEFVYLQELSILDNLIRKFIIGMTLDIEHFLKTKLMKDFADNNLEDGYTIISDLFNSYDYIEESIRKKQNSYCKDLVDKYDGKFAIWNIIELLSFGDFIKLYELYYSKYKDSDSLSNCLVPIQCIRNAAAHNNCLLNSLRKPYNKSIQPNKKINNYVSRIKNISVEERQNRMGNPFIHDFVVMIYVFNNIVGSKKTKKIAMEKLHVLMDKRFIKNKEYFKKEQLIISYYNFMKKVIGSFK